MKSTRTRMWAGLALAGGLGAAGVGCGQVKGEAAGQVAAVATANEPDPTGVTPPRGSSDYARNLAGVRQAYDAVLENLAHAQTPGYRAIRPEFPGPNTPGRADAANPFAPILHRDPRPGKPVHTGRWLDVAIEGVGHLILDDPASGAADGLAYVRAGHLYINLDHELVHGSPDGPRVEPLVIFPDEYADLKIDPEGVVYAMNRPGGEWIAVGQLHLARFANRAGLRESVTGRSVASAESGPPIVGRPGGLGLGQVLQKHLEGSNVDLAEELAELERLKAWGESLASALGVDPGFDDAPVPGLGGPRRVGTPAATSSLSAGR
ncbi:MAG: flagellar hook basal-body protein [Planctomycetota bacterium]